MTSGENVSLANSSKITINYVNTVKYGFETMLDLENLDEKDLAKIRLQNFNKKNRTLI